MSVYALSYVCLVSTEARRGPQTPWNWSYGQLWPTTLGLGLRSESLEEQSVLSAKPSLQSPCLCQSSDSLYAHTWMSKGNFMYKPLLSSMFWARGTFTTCVPSYLAHECLKNSVSVIGIPGICATISGFTWVLGIQTRVLILAWYILPNKPSLQPYFLLLNYLSICTHTHPGCTWKFV